LVHFRLLWLGKSYHVLWGKFIIHFDATEALIGFRHPPQVYLSLELISSNGRFFVQHRLHLLFSFLLIYH
jgi:hypothetical protein